LKATLVLALLLGSMPALGQGTDAQASVLVAAMKAARSSDGFEVRLMVTTTSADHPREELVKFAVVGKFGAQQQHLLIRGISPERIRDHFIVAEHTAEAGVRASTYGPEPSSPRRQASPEAPVFDTRLIVWDMFAPWWNWPGAVVVGVDKVYGRDCVLVRSRAAEPAGEAAVREVLSCVDKDAGVALRTQLFDERHGLLRSVVVTQLLRKQSGLSTAKKTRILASDEASSELEVYSGDEHYNIAADTFSSPGSGDEPRR
jgi:hypothetical protein